MSAHAFLGASGSKMWLTCTPSARAGEHYASTSSDAADEGTCAHDLSELMLRSYLGRITPQAAQVKYNEIQQNKHFNKEMVEICKGFVQYVLELWSMALAYDPKAEIMIETHVRFDKWVPQGYGRLDVGIRSKNWLVIVDLKYGQGVLVDIVGNPQTRLYGAGLYDSLPNKNEIEFLQMHIYQPRMKNIGKDQISIADLLVWLESYVKPQALKAWNGQGDYVAGSHCKFCKNFLRCRTLSEYARGPGRHLFKDPNTLTDDEIVEIYKTTGLLISWNKDAKEFALSKALKGHQWPGLTLTEGRSDRVITDPVKAAQLLYAAGYKEITNVTLKGFGDLESLVGKGNLAEILRDVIIKPQGKPTLIEENAVRKGYKSAQSEFQIRS